MDTQARDTADSRFGRSGVKAAGLSWTLTRAVDKSTPTAIDAGKHAPTRPRIVMAGPLPPAVGGMATVINDLSASTLQEKVSLVLFDTGKSTPPDRRLRHAIIVRLRLWRRWWHTIRQAHGTIAHIHTCSGLSYFLDGTLLVLAKAAGNAAVLHIHGGLFDRFLRDLPLPLRWIAQWLGRRADHVIVLSDAWKEALTPLLPGARMAVIPNGTPPTPGTQPQRSAGKTVTILFLGALSKNKGVWDLLDAVSRLEDNVRLVMLGGEGETGIMDRLKRHIEGSQLAGRVALVGPVHGDAKFQWLQHADIFALPSHVEALPMSLLEAMMSGLPAVVTRVGAMPSVVADQEQGFVVPPEDVEALSGALRLLAEDPRLRQRMGLSAQQHARANYGIDRVVSAYVDLYMKIARKHRR